VTSACARVPQQGGGSRVVVTNETNSHELEINEKRRALRYWSHWTAAEEHEYSSKYTSGASLAARVANTKEERESPARVASPVVNTKEARITTTTTNTRNRTRRNTTQETRKSGAPEAAPRSTRQASQEREAKLAASPREGVNQERAAREGREGRVTREVAETGDQH
jgi:hypothetical protein